MFPLETCEGDQLAAISSLIDNLGASSAAAQGISQPMTSAAKLRGSDQRIYLSSNGTEALGFLKVGAKHLYLYDRMGKLVEADPTCALDFFVCEGCQRKGIGRALIAFFLEAEGVEAREVAWDKPTSKSLALLEKWYSLSSFNPQSNKFVVFDQFFE